MRVGLIDFDSKTPNLAIMKLSTHFKRQGAAVVLNPKPGEVSKAYCSVLFTWNREKAAALAGQFPDIEFGGTGWDVHSTLPPEIEALPPDYDLYTMADIYPRITGIRRGAAREAKVRELLDGGLGFTSRGCIRACPFCVVPKKEGRFHQVGEIRDLVNPRSKFVTLLDANLTADPDVLGKLTEMRERGLTVNITQGVDVRIMTDEIAQALSNLRLAGKDKRIRYAWDLMGYEKQVTEGFATLSRHIKPYRHTCYMLCGFNTTWEEDVYRFRKLRELGVYPYVMIYNKESARQAGTLDLRLMHFGRWVNSLFFKVCGFDDYEPWRKVRDSY